MRASRRKFGRPFLISFLREIAGCGAIQYACCLLLASTAEVAQVRIDPSRTEAEASRFERASSLPTIKCEFKPIKPILGFALHYESGYILRFPLSQFRENGQGIEVLLRFEAESGEGRPSYRTDRYESPSRQNQTMEGEVSGQYPIDSGDWRIDALAIVDDGGVCRGQWKVHVEQARPTANRAGSGRVTVLLDAAPLDWHATTLNDSDITALTDAVSALTERMRNETVRLVIFNPDIETETVVSDFFTPHEAPQLARLMESIQLGVVNYRHLQAQSGLEAFLAHLIRREADKVGRDGRLILLGPLLRPGEQVAKEAIAAAPVPLAPIAYLQYRERGSLRRKGGGSPEDPPNMASLPNNPSLDGLPPPAWQTLASALQPADTIENLIRQVHGQTIMFSTPLEFAKALDRVVK